MAFERVSGGLPVKVNNLEGWVAGADKELFGTGGNDVGIIREFRTEKDKRDEREQDNQKYNRRILAAVALLGTVFPVVMKVLEVLHVIPR